MEAYGELAFRLDFYGDIPSPAWLHLLLQACEGDSAFARRYARLSSVIAELVADFSLVTFGYLNIFDHVSLRRAIQLIDKANGYCFGSVEGAGIGIFTCAQGAEWDEERVGNAPERSLGEADVTQSVLGLTS